MGRPGGRSWQGLIVDLLPILMVGYATFLGLCTWLGDRYRVRSSSMEPSLYGHPEHGDLVWVDKSPWARGRPEVGEVVVVNPEGDDRMPKVKRVAAVGPVDLRIAQGDIWVSPREARQFQRVQKDPKVLLRHRVALFDSRRVTAGQDLRSVFHLPPDTLVESQEPALLTLRAVVDVETLKAALHPAQRKAQRASGAVEASLPGLCCTQRPIDTSYLDPAGRRVWRDLNYYADFGVHLELENLAAPPNAGLLLPAIAPCSLACVLEYRDQDLSLIFELSGSYQLLLGNETLLRGEIEGGPGRSHSVLFAYLDGRAVLLHNGETLFAHAIDLQHPEDYSRPNALHFGAVAAGEAAELRITALELFRDISYSSSGGGQGPEGTYPVPRDHLFLLGDNTNDSTDSRNGLGSVHLSRLLGRPRAILAPASRRRLIGR